MTVTSNFGQKYSRFLLAAATLGVMVGGSIHGAQAATYYVSGLTGNDKNTGKTTSSPLKTIGAITGSSHFASGDIVVVMPGTYNETVKLATAGRAGAYTTLMAQPGAARPVIIGAPTQPGSSDGYGAINIFVPYTRVTGFNVSWQGADGDAISVWGPTAKDNRGVVRPSVHHIDIEDNIAHDAGCGGIDVINADYVTVIGNTTYNNGHTAPNQCSGITLYELTDFDSGSGFRNIVAGNLSYDNFDEVPVPGETYTTDGNGIIIDDSRHTQGDNAAYHGATLVYGNIVFGNGGCGITVFASDAVTVSNNTVYQNQQSKTILGMIGELSSENSGTVSFANNIASSSGPSLPAFIDAGSTKDSWDYNLTSGGGNAVGNAIHLTVGTHNIAGVNPQFVTASTSMATANFHLATTSPALKAGLVESYGVPDFAGLLMTAGTRPNLGAYTR
jgi:parallel beta-helix repeat protein